MKEDKDRLLPSKKASEAEQVVVAKAATTEDSSTSEGDSQPTRRVSVASQEAEKNKVFPLLSGYLKKKSRQRKWQERWFQATGHYLTYFKTQESSALLACIDLWHVGLIQMTPPPPGTSSEAGHLISLSIGDQFYILQADSRNDALRWVTGLRLRQDKSAFLLQSEEALKMKAIDSNHLDRKSAETLADSRRASQSLEKKGFQRKDSLKQNQDLTNDLVSNANEKATELSLHVDTLPDHLDGKTEQFLISPTTGNDMNNVAMDSIAAERKEESTQKARPSPSAVNAIATSTLATPTEPTMKTINAETSQQTFPATVQRLSTTANSTAAYKKASDAPSSKETEQFNPVAVVSPLVAQVVSMADVAGTKDSNATAVASTVATGFKPANASMASVLVPSPTILPTTHANADTNANANANANIFNYMNDPMKHQPLREEENSRGDVSNEMRSGNPCCGADCTLM